MAPNIFAFPPPPPPPPKTSYQSYPNFPANQSRTNPTSHQAQYGTYRGRGHGNGFRGSTQPRANTSQRQSYGFHSPHQQSPRGFGRDRATAPRAPAAPAVPRFGLPLPSKPTPTPEKSVPVKKRKREHNQLGLTPKQEEHVSSEEDLDEEEHLARTMGISGNAQIGLQFTYNGRSSTLKTASELAAWLAERKKRYPTRARAEEEKARKSKQREEARLERIAKLEQERKEKEEHSAQFARLKAEESIERRRDKQWQSLRQGEELSREEKAIIKADKLRRKYEKAQEKVARLTARISSPEVKMEDIPKSASMALRETTIDDLKVAEHAATGHDIEALLTPVSQTHSPILASKAGISDLSESKAALELAVEARDQHSDTLSEVSSSSDSNSLDFSDSILSDSDSDEISEESSDDEEESSDSDAPPRELSSKVLPSEPVDYPKPPPPRQVKNELCKSYLRNGRCPFQSRCRYKHELPPRGAQQKVEQKQEARSRKKISPEPVAPRLNLYQRMVLQEKERENEAILDHIIYLGERGLLKDRELAE